MKILLLALVLAPVAVSRATAQELYVQAIVDAQQRLTITKADGSQIVLTNIFDTELDSQQVEFRRVALSPNGRTVGWVTYYSNGGAPFPRKLEVYSGGQRRTIANRVPVSAWCFLNGGDQVALLREQLNGPEHPAYYLVATSTGKELAVFAPPDGSPSAARPDWVVAVDRLR